MRLWSTLIATVFGVGYGPKAPGTWGSLIALSVAWYCNISWLNLTALCAVGGFATYHYIQQPGKQKDPKEVVIDEVAGQWIALMFAPKTLLGFTLAFFLFRLLDIWKPWPISWADRLNGNTTLNAISVMLDDILAGFIAGIFILLYYLILP